MKVGFLTSVFGQRSFDGIVAWASEQKFDALEVSTHHLPPERVLDKGEADRIKANLAQKRIEISSLAHYSNLLLPDTAERAKAVDRFKMVLDAAAALNVKVVCTMAGMPVPGKSKDQTLREDFAQVFKPLLKYADASGIKIAMENWYPTLIQNLELWQLALDCGEYDNLGFNFDPSHLYWQGIDYLYAVDEFGNRIFHTHAKDTEIKADRLRIVGNQVGGWWRYCIPGYGGIQWGQYIARLRGVKYEGVLSIEHEDWTFTPETGLIKGRDYLRQLA